MLASKDIVIMIGSIQSAGRTIIQDLIPTVTRLPLGSTIS